MSKQEHLDTTADVLEGQEGLAEPVQEQEAPEKAEADEIDAKIGRLEEELATLRQEKDSLYNKMLRAQADFENFRRRSKQEFEQLCLYSGEELMKKILPVLDSMERAVACFDTANDNARSWQEGIVLILRQFQNILQADGLEEVPAVNEPFNPELQEAVLQEESDAVQCPTVVEQMQKGYKYKGKLIRPALVKVAVPKQ
ncbi:MAG: nucleotide exchange factor GrpE [Bacteroidota bacterium]